VHQPQQFRSFSERVAPVLPVIRQYDHTVFQGYQFYGNRTDIYADIHNVSVHRKSDTGARRKSRGFLSGSAVLSLLKIMKNSIFFLLQPVWGEGRLLPGKRAELSVAAMPKKRLK